MPCVSQVASINLMKFQHIYYPESRFGGYTDIDGSIAFYTRVNSLLKPGDIFLDVGCGRGEYAEDPVVIRRNLRIFKGKCRRVLGMDVDPRASTNPFVDEFHLITEDKWALKDESVDLCLCDNVIEHIENPYRFLAECTRVLKQGGHLCMRTTNLWSYIGLGSWLLPNRFHAPVLTGMQSLRKSEDVFPTLYRANSVNKLQHLLGRYGFDHCVYGYESEPNYLSFSRPFYFLGVMYQRFAPKRSRSVILAFGKKQG